MKKLLVISALVSTALAFASMSVFADEYRVVVKKAKSAPLLLSKQTKFSGGVNTGNTLIVTANSEEEALAKVRESGLYSSVEIDYLVSAGKPPAAGDERVSVHAASLTDTPNDIEFVNQYYWGDPEVDGTTVERWLGRSNLLKAHNMAKQNYKTRVGVVDSSFGVIQDVHYAEGYSFTTVFNRARTAKYTTDDDILELTGGAHGLSISAIIGAHTNNEIGMAGIAKTEIVAAQAMYGGNGYLSDVADSVIWLSGGVIPDVPNISTPVDVINMSLAGKTGDCPTYIQDAIDFANARGIIVVVAAGNDNADTRDYSPANCKDVITVGAVNIQGNKADFSNYGATNDIMAQGEGIYAPGHDQKYFWWDGTSQASPIVAGAILLAKAEFKWITRSDAEDLLKLTARVPAADTDNPDTSCAGDRCGSGSLDTAAFLAEVRAYMDNTDSFIKHVLTDETCLTDTMAAFEGQLKLCSMYEVTLAASPESGVIYDIYEVPANKEFSLANATKVLTVDSDSEVTGDYQFKENTQYGYVKCLCGSCAAKMVRMGTSDIAKPARCL